MAGIVLVVVVQVMLLMVVAMTVVQDVLTVNLTVAMVLVLLVHGHVMAGRTVQTVLTKLIVAVDLKNVQIAQLIILHMVLNVVIQHGTNLV
jgi:hypothetical protein